MEDQKPKYPQKGAVKRLRELYEKTKGKASPELLEILKSPPAKEKQDQKKSALPQQKDTDL